MSLAASADTAADTAVLSMFADKHGGGKRWEDQLQVDLYTQFIISSALGLSAFLTFCVRIKYACQLSLLTLFVIGLTTKMDRAVCCATTPT